MKSKKLAVHKTVRYPADLNDKLEKRAKKENWSFTGAVVYFLNKVIDKK
jgi:hypothetical protein